MMWAQHAEAWGCYWEMSNGTFLGTLAALCLLACLLMSELHWMLEMPA